MAQPARHREAAGKFQLPAIQGGGSEQSNRRGVRPISPPCNDAAKQVDWNKLSRRLHVPDSESSDRVLDSAAGYFGDVDPGTGYYRLYFALLRINRTIMPGIERALKAVGLADPVWFEILLAAEEAGAQGVQMLTLQRRLFVQQYALSRHIARMERAGLICRSSARGVGRGQTIRLTNAAAGLQERVWQVYRQHIEAAFADRLSTDEAYAALRLMNRLYP